MEFFRHNKGRLQMCLPVDPNLCGNLEIQGKLKKILPDLEDGNERVDTCVDNFHSFCSKLLGGGYKWIYHTTSKICGEQTFTLKHDINVVSYDTVAVYKGETDSILGKAFVDGHRIPCHLQFCFRGVEDSVHEQHRRQFCKD